MGMDDLPAALPSLNDHRRDASRLVLGSTLCLHVRVPGYRNHHGVWSQDHGVPGVAGRSYILKDSCELFVGLLIGTERGVYRTVIHKPRIRSRRVVLEGGIHVELTEVCPSGLDEGCGGIGDGRLLGISNSWGRGRACP